MVMSLELINKIIWAIVISFIIINSIYFSIKLRFPQIKLIKKLKLVLKKDKKTGISPRDTLIMALSSKIGVGSLSGTAICIYYGGIGTIFWIFISTFFLSIITYIENALAIIYKEKKGSPRSGPNYYIKKGLGYKKLSIVYAFLVMIVYAVVFPSIQTNTVITLTTDMYSIDKLVLSFFISFLSFLIIIKGIKSISNICNKIFPIMMIVFILIGMTIIIKNISIIPQLFSLILKEAFNPKPITGSIVHTLIITFQRSIFANESGVGTSAIISGATESNDYHLQATIGLIQTYFINFVILGLTALIIITAPDTVLDVTNGIEVTKHAFFYHLGSFGEVILLVILSLFSFSTIITVYYYGESALSFLTNKKTLFIILKIVTAISILVGGIVNGSTIWDFIDIFLGMLTIINMFSIYKLREKIISKLK